MSRPIRLHPEDPKLYEYRGKPAILLCATEHYGAVLNRSFDYRRYLRDAKAKGQNYTRLFILFRELQAALNPYSTLKPESTEYVAPYPRTGPGRARDGLPRYDLDRWDPEFFDRLRDFLGTAERAGVVVEVTVFSNTYGDAVFALNPLHPDNNVNGLPRFPWTEWLTERHPAVLARQDALLAKVLEETAGFGNVIYEVCNEPGGWPANDKNLPSQAEIDAWGARHVRAIRAFEAGRTRKHLIAGQGAFEYGTFIQTTDVAFRDLDVDVVNLHPLSDCVIRGKTYDLGPFMMKRLRLPDFRTFCLESRAYPKPFCMDEDNSASRFMDHDGWVIHRKRAWTAAVHGVHYDYIDFAINKYHEKGTPEDERTNRTWFKHLTAFIHSFDLAGLETLAEPVASSPAHTIVSGMKTGNEILLYVADARELPEPGSGDEGPGGPIGGELRLDLPAGGWNVAFFGPETGKTAAAGTIRGGKGVRIGLPAFRHDIAVRLTRTGG